MKSYANKPKKVSNESVANAVSLKTNTKAPFQLEDNRPKAVVQQKLNESFQNDSQNSTSETIQQQASGVIQRKYDHLFNDIPKTLSNLPPSLRSSKIAAIRAHLNTLRDDKSNGVDGQHDGEDDNAVQYGHAQASFLTAAYAYAESKIDARAMRQATYILWKFSVDADVAKSVKKSAGKIQEWHSMEKLTWEALTAHTSIHK